MPDQRGQRPAPIRVVIVCAAGMSSSLLETRVKKAAEEAGILLEVRAVPAGFVPYWNPDTIEIDVVLIAPQVRFARRAIERVTQSYGIIVQVIDSMAYGMVDGEKIVQQIVAAVNQTL